MTPRILVIGGGISGLAAAHRLRELSAGRGQPLDVTILEAQARPGGVIQTGHRDDLVLEAGPDCFITDKPWALALCRRIGLAPHLVSTNPRFRRSFVAHQGRLVAVPEGFQLLAPARLWPFLTSPVFSPLGKLRMGLDLILPAAERDDESLAAFVERRLGREALERMAQPMVAGIYGADPRELSLRATLPRFLEMEREHGSVIRALWSNARRGTARQVNGNASGSTGVSGARYSLFASFDTGMQLLVDSLVKALPPGCLRMGVRALALARAADGGWMVKTHEETTGQESEIWADAICLALPAHAAAALMHTGSPDMRRVAACLDEIPYGSCATMNLWYPRSDVPHPLDGFGFVAPRSERLSILGCTFSSVKLPGRAPRDVALLRAFIGHEMAEQWDDASIEAAVQADLRTLLGTTASPQGTTLHRHLRAMAHYTVGHLARLETIERQMQTIPGLALAGNGGRGIGIPDCIRSGEMAAEALLGYLASSSLQRKERTYSGRTSEG